MSNNEQAGMSGHAKRSPSKSGRIILCAASAEREAKYPDEKSNPAANRGTNSHWLLNQGLATDTWPPAVLEFAPDKLKKMLPYPDDGLDDELIEYAKLCYDYVQKCAADRKPSAIRSEVHVVPSIYTGRDDDDGSADALIVTDPMLEVVDLKTGGTLAESDCSQLKLYALGAMAEYADPSTGLAPFKIVRLTIFQPKRPGEMQIARSTDCTQQELIDWAADVWAPAAHASEDPNARATPSDEACKHCKAQKNRGCPEYQAFVSQSAATLFSPVVPYTEADPMLTQFRVEDLSPEQISQFLEAWPLIKARGKDIEEYAASLIKSQKSVPGFKLVEGRGSRGWSLSEEEMAKKFRNMHIKKDDVFAQKLRSPAQMMALDIPTNKKEAIKKYIVHKAGSLTIAPANDKRRDALPAVEFKPVEKEAPQAPSLDFLSL